MIKLNQVTLTGNLGKDAEIREVGQKKVASFSIGVTESFKDKEGQWQNKTFWMDCKYWLSDKDTKSANLLKGKSVLVAGRLTQEEWEKDGVKRTKFVLNVQDVQFADKIEKSTNSEPMPATVVETAPPPVESAAPTIDDLPF
jgi:single-strand DNA-binding protein